MSKRKVLLEIEIEMNVPDYDDEDKLDFWLENNGLCDAIDMVYDTMSETSE